MTIQEHIEIMRAGVRATRPALQDDMDDYDHAAVMWYSGYCSALMMLTQRIEEDSDEDSNTE